MAFVKTKFPLPTVSRANGTLGGYVKMLPATSGPQFRFPADRLALYQQQQKAAAAAARKKSWGLKGVTDGDTPAPTISLVPIGPAQSPDAVASGNIDAPSAWQNGLNAVLAVINQKAQNGAKPSVPATSPMSTNSLMGWGAAALGTFIVVLAVSRRSH